MGTRLRLRFPSHVEVAGLTVNGQRTKIKEIIVPLHFTSPKGPTSAAFVELLAQETSEDPVSDYTLMVSGRDGSVKIQSNRNDFVEPAFLAALSQSATQDDEDGDEDGDEGDDDEDTEEEDEGDEDDEGEEGEA